MRYTITLENGQPIVIQVGIQFGTSPIGGGAAQTIEYNGKDNVSFETVLNNIVDNMRLTVAEREAARSENAILLQFLSQKKNGKTQIINEDAK